MADQIEIITGSMLGATEYVAEQVQTELHQAGFNAEVHFQPDITQIRQSGIWVLCSSTHGAGDLPDNIQAFANALPDSDLSQIQFIVIALGDSSYDTFCQAGKTLYELMCKSGAKPLSELFCIDVLQHPMPEEVAGEWLANQLAGGLFESN
ncbi:FMN-binding protein MioC [Planctobacterium marinum]|uniref:Protein MioC n=1 Tax=Planctobacterium marinum TaxID=1631968 RepID=A0AA48KUL3_9ALTE|nr:protein MioC [Planctobacterium marinum]